MENSGLRNTSPLRIAAVLLLAGFLCAPSLVSAEEIYKSVDADGNVTYSSVPTAEAVETQAVSVPDAPTAAQQQEAIQRERQLQQAADNLARDRSARDSQRGSAVQDAENARDQAKVQLEQALVKQDRDWQGLAGGGRRLKESYFERVRNAQENLRQTEESLSKARRDMR